MVAVSALVKRTKEGTVRAYSFAILFVFEKKWEVNDAAVMHGSKWRYRRSLDSVVQQISAYDEVV